MALKGKKKSRSRGSQARRRPAAAPRPVVGPRRRTPWYRTQTGRIVAGAAAIIVLGLAIWAVTSVRSRSAERAERRDEVDAYTGEVRALVQTLTPTASAMSAAGGMPEARLAKESKAWSKDLGDAQTELTDVTPPTGLEGTNSLILQSILLYSSAADTYVLAPDVRGDAAQKVQEKGTSQWAAANAVFQGVVQIIDAEREELGLPASNLRAPGLGQPPSGPTETPGAGQAGTTVNEGGGKQKKKDRGPRDDDGTRDQGKGDNGSGGNGKDDG